MKKTASILLIAIVITGQVIPLVCFGWFLLNQTEIIAEQCVNRNTANSSCKGKCVLGQKLAAQKEQRQAAMSLVDCNLIPGIIESEQLVNKPRGISLIWMVGHQDPITQTKNIFVPPG